MNVAFARQTLKFTKKNIFMPVLSDIIPICLFFVVMDPDQNILTQVGSANHLWFGSGFGKFPLKIPNFSMFCPSGQKNIFGSGQKVSRSNTGQPLIYCWPKECRVGSSQGPSLIFGFGEAQD